MNYRPLNDLLLVERMPKDEISKTAGGIILTTTNLQNIFTRLRVIKIGSLVKDIKEGDIILAEDMFEKITKDNDLIGIINQKYVHLIEEQNV